MDAKLIERFSKRSQQRDMAVKRQETKLGRKLTKKEIAHVVHQSRPKKLKGVSDEQVRDQQLGEIGFFEKRVLTEWSPPPMATPKLLPNMSGRMMPSRTALPMFLNAARSLRSTRFWKRL